MARFDRGPGREMVAAAQYVSDRDSTLFPSCLNLVVTLLLSVQFRDLAVQVRGLRPVGVTQQPRNSFGRYLDERAELVSEIFLHLGSFRRFDREHCPHIGANGLR